jgi:hypothetical protein
MLSEKKFEELIDKAEDWLHQHVSISEIKMRIEAEGANESEVVQLMNHVKKIYYAEKRKRGTLIILAGSVLLLIGFIMTVFNFHSNTSFQYVMYGFTSAGLLVIFFGLYDIFG